MVNYRRNRVAGGTYFFTVTLRDRRSDLLVREIDALKQAWRNVARRVPHLVVAAVVLPEHLHAVIQMDASTDDYPRLWQDIKKGFTRGVFATGQQTPWQARYWERTRENRGQSRVSENRKIAENRGQSRVSVLALCCYVGFAFSVSAGSASKEGDSFPEG